MLRVQANALKNARGESAVLHGVSLPSLADLSAAGLDPVQVLETHARNGAAVARLAVDDAELVPVYVPLKLLPLVERAEALNVVLVLAFRNIPTDKLDKQIDQAEDFLRLAVPALRGHPSVWLEPLDQRVEAPEGRRRTIAERLIDVVRGQGDNRVLVIGDASWLASADPAINAPLRQRNIVYAVRTINDWPSAVGESLPRFMTVPATPSEIAAAAAAGIGTTSADTASSDIWKSSRGCR